MSGGAERLTAADGFIRSPVGAARSARANKEFNCEGHMKKKYFLILGILSIISALYCCSDSDDGVSCPSKEENLIGNSSFEFDGVQSLDGWIIEDPGGVAFSDDVPEGGGSWSVEIDPGGVSQTNKISYKIPAPQGEHRYRFSFCAKRQSINGNARLWIKKSDVNLIVRVIGVSSAYWIQYSALATLNTQSGDTIFVELDGGSTEVSAVGTRYDLVELIKLN